MPYHFFYKIVDLINVSNIKYNLICKIHKIVENIYSYTQYSSVNKLNVNVK